jgi:hypothetical protein
MKFILTLSILLFWSAAEAQNLYISTGLYFSKTQTVVMNDHISDPFSSSGPVKGPEKFDKTSFYPNLINILFAKNLGKHLSLKTGFYIHSNKGTWTEIFYDMSVHGNWSWREHSYINNFSLKEIDLPLLLSYNINKGEKKFGVKNLNIGPYFGYIYKGTDDATSSFPVYLYRFDYGCNLSVGFGSEKWQISIYLLKGIRNLYKHNIYYPNLQRVTPDMLGVNLTRVIYFSE